MDRDMLERLAQAYENDEEYYSHDLERVDLARVYRDMVRTQARLARVAPIDRKGPIWWEVERLASLTDPADPEIWGWLAERLTDKDHAEHLEIDRKRLLAETA